MGRHKKKIKDEHIELNTNKNKEPTIYSSGLSLYNNIKIDDVLTMATISSS